MQPASSLIIHLPRVYLDAAGLQIIDNGIRQLARYSAKGDKSAYEGRNTGQKRRAVKREQGEIEHTAQHKPQVCACL